MHINEILTENALKILYPCPFNFWKIYAIITKYEIITAALQAEPEPKISDFLFCGLVTYVMKPDFAYIILFGIDFDFSIA